jgi:hypothetical protein
MSQPGVCEFCGITDADIDGDRLWWTSPKRDCCNKYGCIKAKKAKERRARALRPKRNTPADIHRLIREEAAAKRKRYRDAAKKRGLLREAPGVEVIDDPTPQQLEEFHTDGTDARVLRTSLFDAVEERKTA